MPLPPSPGPLFTCKATAKLGTYKILAKKYDSLKFPYPKEGSSSNLLKRRKKEKKMKREFIK